MAFHLPLKTDGSAGSDFTLKLYSSSEVGKARKT